MNGGDDGGHDAADAVEDGDRRIVALGSEAAIEEGAGGVDQGIVFVVAFHENGVEGGDGAGTEGARALDEAGEQSKDRGRVAFGGRRLAGGESDFALRHGETGER